MGQIKQLIAELEYSAQSLKRDIEDLHRPWAGMIEDEYEAQREADESYLFEHPEA